MTEIALNDRPVIVTGASRGMGREMADALLAAGARVGLVSPEKEELQATAEALAGTHGRDRVLALVCDITDYDACRRAVAETLSAFGGLEGLVNHAGLGPLHAAPADAPTENLPFWVHHPDAWAKVIEVNMIGTFFMTHAAIGPMRERGLGRIVNVSTSLSGLGRPHRSPYACSKAGIESETLIFAQDLEGSGVTVNTLIPGGAVRTRFVSEARLKAGGLQDPDILRRPVVWLMSDLSAGHTGQRFNARYWNDEDLERAVAEARTVPAYRVPPAGGTVRTGLATGGRP